MVTVDGVHNFCDCPLPSQCAWLRHSFGLTGTESREWKRRGGDSAQRRPAQLSPLWSKPRCGASNSWARVPCHWDTKGRSPTGRSGPPPSPVSAHSRRASGSADARFVRGKGYLGVRTICALMPLWIAQANLCPQIGDAASVTPIVAPFGRRALECDQVPHWGMRPSRSWYSRAGALRKRLPLAQTLRPHHHA